MYPKYPIDWTNVELRHPQYLWWILFSVAITLISQYWLVALIGIAAAVTVYMQAQQEDQPLVEKFGADYERYMQSVPRMNLLLRTIRLLRRRDSL